MPTAPGRPAQLPRLSLQCWSWSALSCGPPAPTTSRPRQTRRPKLPAKTQSSAPRSPTWLAQLRALTRLRLDRLDATAVRYLIRHVDGDLLARLEPVGEAHDGAV